MPPLFHHASPLLAALLALSLFGTADLAPTTTSAPNPCPKGWRQGITFPNKCYYYIEEGDKFFAALEKCRALRPGADLIAFKNNFEIQEIFDWLNTPPYYGAWAWTSYVDWYHNGTWYWMSQGGGYNATPQILSDDHGCTYMIADTDNEKRFFCSWAGQLNEPLCQLYLEKPEPSLPQPLNDCPTDWFSSLTVPGKCYHFLFGQTAWTDVEKECKSLNATMVAFTGPADAAEFAEYASEFPVEDYDGQENPPVWIGYAYDKSTASWNPTVPGADKTYFNWAPGQPNLKNGTCVLFDTEAIRYAWDSANCAHTYYGACQRLML